MNNLHARGKFCDSFLNVSFLTLAESAYSLFVKSMHLVCHRLISVWKMDLNVSLAALEFLSGLARIRIREMGKNMFSYYVVYSVNKLVRS